MAEAQVTWQNRIVSYGTKPASQFMAHPLNWRKHPQRQRSAVKGSLDSLGWVSVVIENRRTGNLVDGHERIWHALQNGDAEVPFILVDLSPEEEAQALLSLDAIAALAQTDAGKVDELLRMVDTDNQDVMQFLGDMAKDAGLDYGVPELEDQEQSGVERYVIGRTGINGYCLLTPQTRGKELVYRLKDTRPLLSDEISFWGEQLARLVENDDAFVGATGAPSSGKVPQEEHLAGLLARSVGVKLGIPSGNWVSNTRPRASKTALRVKIQENAMDNAYEYTGPSGGVLIVDDITLTGGTLLRCIEVMNKGGAIPTGLVLYRA